MNRAQYLGLGCFIGGLLFAGVNSSEVVGLALETTALLVVLDIVLLLGLMGGPLGALALQATGDGKMGRVGRVGAGIALLGLISYIVGELYTNLVDPEMGIFYALGALLSGVGMLPLGIAVLRARQLQSWRRFAPLLVGAYYLVMIPLQIVFFIIPGGKPSSLLLAGWGLTWALLGYAVFSASRRARALVMSATASG